MAENESLATYWWKESKENVHETLFSIVRFLDQNQSYIKESNLRHMRLYGNVNALGLSAHTYAQSQSSAFDRVTLNVIQSMCDTVTNKIAKNKPKPTFLTDDGNWTMKEKAKLLDKFVLGQFYATDFYAKAQRGFLDGAVFGTGPLKIYRERNKICVERTFINELKVDQAEAIYGNPRNLYQLKPISKEAMVSLYSQHKAKILACRVAEDSNPVHANLSNMIDVLEAWHLPSEKGAKDGRHVICIENQVLLDEPWKRTRFPFVFLRWKNRLLGFFGQGLAEELTGIQVEINKILRTIQTSFHLLGAPAVLVEQGSDIVKAHLNNEVGRIIKYKGVMPQLWAQNPVAAQLFEHLDRLYQRAYEIAGVSMLSSQSKKPAGLDSGKALREFNDIESERFLLVGQMWEQAHTEAASHMIELGREIYEEEGKYEVVTQGRDFIERIDWSQVDMEEDQYVMQVFPTSMLSQTPAGRLQDVQELVQAGFVDKRNALRLLDYPDLKSYTSLANAAADDIEKMIEKMLSKGEYQSPEPFQDLAFGMQLVQSAYLKARNDNAPEENLELLRRWMGEADKMLNPQPDPATQPLPGLPMGQPTGVAAQPPVSTLLPSAPGVM